MSIFNLIIQCWCWQNWNFHSNWRPVRTWSDNWIYRYHGVCSNDEKRSNEYDSNQSKFRSKMHCNII